MLLEKVVRFNFPAASQKYTQLVRAMGVPSAGRDDSETAALLTERIASMGRDLGINQRLKEMGVTSTDLPQLAEYASKDPCLATNPRGAETARGRAQ